MDRLEGIRNALHEFASGLRLEEEALPGVFDAGLLDTSLFLEDLVTAEFSTALAKRSVALRLATKLLIEDPAPESMALVLNELSGLVADMGEELRPHPAASEYHLARLYAEVATQLTGPRPAENQGFKKLPRLLLDSPWLRAELERLAGAADVPLAKTPAGRGFSKAAASAWLKRTRARGEGLLAAAVEHTLGEVETRSRQVWTLRACEGVEEMSQAQLYARAHAEIFPDFPYGLSERSLELETAKLKGLALGLQLSELVPSLDSAEWLGQYALSYLLPPSPAEWAVRHAGQLRHLLRARLSRWYSLAFDHRLEPLEMVAGVLRLGRPLFYDRVAAHALLEYALLQGVAFGRQAAPFYLDALGVLEREFQNLFDGALLRQLYYPRLKAPEGWRDYLAALHQLHFGLNPNAELDECRHQYLARRGLRTTFEILYRITASHSAIN